jgi:hypothetical protein
LLPENVFLSTVAKDYGVHLPVFEQGIIGSNFVRGMQSREPQASVTKKFLNSATSIRRTKTAEYDDNVYYLPYLKNYFCGLEDAYTNISRYLDSECEGCIIVVNNTHRGLVIPVSESVQEIWRSLGFSATVLDSRESFHFGTKNPRAKGVRARHTEYVVRIWR